MGVGDKKLIELTDRAIGIFWNPNFLLLRKLASISQVNISKGAKIAEEALSFFNNQNYNVLGIVSSVIIEIQWNTHIMKMLPLVSIN